MKFLSASLFLILLQCTLFSQVPNGGFEQWTQGEPDGWKTSNVPGILTVVTQSTDAYTGSGAVKGEVKSFFTTVLAPIIQSGPDAKGFTITQKYSTFKGYFKFSPIGGDRLAVQAAVLLGLDSLLGIGAVAISTPMTGYTEITIPIAYMNPGEPNLCIIQASIIGPNTGNDYHPGSIFFADDFSLSGTAVGISGENISPLSFSLGQNYPNPFNPSTTIRYSVPAASEVEFSVMNILGKEVYRETFYREPGSYEINFSSGDLSNGVYFYSLKAGKYSSTRKFIILK